MLRFIDRERTTLVKILSIAGAVFLTHHALAYWNKIDANTTGVVKLDEKRVGDYNYAFFASCAPREEVTFDPPYRGRHEIISGVTVVAATNSPDGQIKIKTTPGPYQQLSSILGIYSLEAKFSERIGVKGIINCYPPNPFRR